MDLATISTAVALLAILLAWYALLEYEDRRWKGVGRTKRGPAEDGRGAGNGRSRHLWIHGTGQQRRSNGHQPAGRRSLPAQAAHRLPPRGSYGLAVAGVLTAYPVVTLVDVMFSFPPFIFFAAAVAVAFTLAGRGPGLLALLLATTLSDFFFVEPTFVFSMDWQVFRLSLIYFLGGLLSVFISRRLSARRSS
jgi:hypothetical protein